MFLCFESKYDTVKYVRQMIIFFTAFGIFLFLEHFVQQSSIFSCLIFTPNLLLYLLHKNVCVVEQNICGTVNYLLISHNIFN